jgi:prophage regulatory protein
MTQIKIYRIQEVCDRTGLKPSTIYKLIRENNFPRGVRLTARSTGWSSHSVDNWISERIGVV